jgi:hypothetical protein
MCGARAPWSGNRKRRFFVICFSFFVIKEGEKPLKLDSAITRNEKPKTKNEKRFFGALHGY